MRWSVRAVADRNAIFEYVEADSPQAAAAVDTRIRSAISDLKMAPGVGRPGRVEGTRELVIHRTPYIAAYNISGDTIRILRLLHGAQRWPEKLPIE